MTPKRKHYWMYIPLDLDKNKGERFVVETDEVPDAGQYLFSGKVVAYGPKAKNVHIGYRCDRWCNPIWDMAHGNSPSFVIIHRDMVKGKFENAEISD